MVDPARAADTETGRCGPAARAEWTGWTALGPCRAEPAVTAAGRAAGCGAAAGGEAAARAGAEGTAAPGAGATGGMATAGEAALTAAAARSTACCATATPAWPSVLGDTGTTSA